MTWIVAGVLGFMFYTAMTSNHGTSPSTSADVVPAPQPAPATAQGPELEVQSWRCETENGYVHVRGEVKSISSSNISNVMAVGAFRTKSGDLIKSADALIDYNPIMPGQTSPFHALASGNPQMTNCNLAFRSLSGRSISYREKGKK